MDAQSEADRAYANGAFIPGAEGFPPRWTAAAAAFRDRHPPEDIAYGPGARNRLDLFRPKGTPRGLLVFFHGGYWMAFDRRDWSHLAAGALARGWACALPSYTLAPAARIASITGEARAACAAAAHRVPGPLVVAGHSAGGHLAARLGCADGPAQVARVVPVSPLAELAPLMETTMNATLGIDAAAAAADSPARLPLRAEAHVWVGGQERPAFLWQARTLSEAWGCPWTVAPGRHHFDVIDDLADPGSALVGVCLDGL
jgi:acetyl esterase/lipase